MSSKKQLLFRLKKIALNKNIRWMHDFDYLDSLSHEELLWLAQFIKEYYQGNVKKGDYDALHVTDELRRDCYNKKNAQNRDLYSIVESQFRLKRLERDKNEHAAKEELEKRKPSSKKKQ